MQHVYNKRQLYGRHRPTTLISLGIIRAKCQGRTVDRQTETRAILPRALLLRTGDKAIVTNAHKAILIYKAPRFE